MKGRSSLVQKVIVMVLLAGCISCTGIGCGQNTVNHGEQLYLQAKTLEAQGKLTSAEKLYTRAYRTILPGDNSSLVKDCWEGAERVALFKATYPLTERQLESYLSRNFPEASREQIKTWIEEDAADYYQWDGQNHYRELTAANILFKHFDLIQARPDIEESYREFFYTVRDEFIDIPVEVASEPRSLTYRGTQYLNIPRVKLPGTGLFKIWFPIPINIGPQTQVVIESIAPDKYVKEISGSENNIGLIYMEIPLDELKTDLDVRIVFRFIHSEQTCRIDPAKINEYDKTSPLYLENTVSAGNIEITPEIRATAVKLVREEKNPYLAARLIYDYIVNSISYAFMPHELVWPRTALTESVYVQQYRQGDCGAQSIYFCALCRALGIPARCIGGWQVFSGQFIGHFWAEFYLPGYGWIPVDTSYARMGLYPKDIPPEQRQQHIDYFFGNLDPMRCIVQVGVDTPLVPPADYLVLRPISLQEVTGLCPAMTDDIPGALLNSFWKIECELLTGGR